MVDGGEESRISQSDMNHKSRCSVSARIMGFSRSLRSSHIWVDRVCVRLSSTTWTLSSSTVGTDKLVNKLFTCVTAKPGTVVGGRKSLVVLSNTKTARIPDYNESSIRRAIDVCEIWLSKDAYSIAETYFFRLSIAILVLIVCMTTYRLNIN